MASVKVNAITDIESTVDELAAASLDISYAGQYSVDPCDTREQCEYEQFITLEMDSQSYRAWLGVDYIPAHDMRRGEDGGWAFGLPQTQLRLSLLGSLYLSASADVVEIQRTGDAISVTFEIRIDV